MGAMDTKPGPTTQPRTVTNRQHAGANGMTLGDLSHFLADCVEARVDINTVLRVRSSMTGRILQIQATDGAR